MIILVFEDAVCALCGKELDLFNYDNEAKYVPTIGLVCGDCNYVKEEVCDAPSVES